MKRKPLRLDQGKTIPIERLKKQSDQFDKFTRHEQWKLEYRLFQKQYATRH